MKLRLLFFVVFFLFGNDAISVFAQKSVEELMANLLSLRHDLEREVETRIRYRSIWDGQGSVIATALYMGLPEGQADLALSEEQSERLAIFNDGQLLQRRAMNKPGVMIAMGAMEMIVPKDDQKLANATEAQKQRYKELFAKPVQIMLDDLQNEVETTLTPEQMLKVRALELQLLPEKGLPSPTMFEPLGLSDEQKEEMAAIKKALEPEFEKLLDETAKIEVEESRLLYETLAKMHKENPFETTREYIDAISPTLNEVRKDDRLAPKLKEIAEKGQNFTKKLKVRLMNVLTDAQLDKMQELLDNTPEFVRKELERLRKEREEREKAGIWVPGPDSWRPGDGIPAELEQERKKGRFPSKPRNSM